MQQDYDVFGHQKSRARDFFDPCDTHGRRQYRARFGGLAGASAVDSAAQSPRNTLPYPSLS